MEVKEIFKLLSQEANEISYSSFLYESPAEKFCFLTAIGAFSLFLLANIFKAEVLALLSICISIFFLFGYSISSLIKDKDFILNPIKFYANQLITDIDVEQDLVSRLSNFPQESLKKAKEVCEHEHLRINKK